MTVTVQRDESVLVTGATGAIGPVVVQRLVESGYQVRALARTPYNWGALATHVEPIAGDILDSGSLKIAMRGCTHVVHLAALLHLTDPPPSMRQKYWEINVEGARNVVQAAGAEGVKRVVLASTIAVYGSTGSAAVDEASPPHPDTMYAETKLDAERIVLAARNVDGAPLGCVLRLSAVYGEQIKGNYQRLLLSLARGRFAPIGPGRNRRTLVYDADVANAFLLALDHPAAAGGLYNVTDGESHSLQEIIAAMCDALGKPAPRLVVPVAAVRAAAVLAEGLAPLLGRQAPITQATIDKYLEETVIAGDLIQRELGFKPQYGLCAGWGDAVQKMRRSGLLAR